MATATRPPRSDKCVKLQYMALTGPGGLERAGMMRKQNGQQRERGQHSGAQPESPIQDYQYRTAGQHYGRCDIEQPCRLQASGSHFQQTTPKIDQLGQPQKKKGRGQQHAGDDPKRPAIQCKPDAFTHVLRSKSMVSSS